MPIEEPARADFTNSGQPCSPAKSTILLRAAQASRSHSRGRITTYGPTSTVPDGPSSHHRAISRVTPRVANADFNALTAWYERDLTVPLGIPRSSATARVLRSRR